MGTTCCPSSTGRRRNGPGKVFVYFSDDGDVLALRYDNWKVVFMEQRAPGLARCGWSRSFRFGFPTVQSADRPLRTGRHQASITELKTEHLFIVVPAAALVIEFLEIFKDFPPRQEARVFTSIRRWRRCSRHRGRTEGAVMLDSWNDTPTRAAIESYV